MGRKYELYSMDWDLKEELRDCLVAAAPYGGPIGMSRLYHCVFWDNGVNSMSVIPGGLAIGLFLLMCASPLSFPPLTPCQDDLNFGSHEACFLWGGPGELDRKSLLKLQLY